MKTSVWNTDCQISERQLLQCVVEVAKAAFQAAACSVFIVDEQNGDVVFEAVAGEGEDHLVGTRFSIDTGIVGWVVASGQPVITDDLAASSFSRSAADQTGYLPQTIAAAPLVRDGTVVGVLEVLDRRLDCGELETLELLGLLASQAAAGIELLQRVRHSSRREDGRRAQRDPGRAVVDRIAAALPHLDADESRLVAQALAVVGDLVEVPGAGLDATDRTAK